MYLVNIVFLYAIRALSGGLFHHRPSVGAALLPHFSSNRGVKQREKCKQLQWQFVRSKLVGEEVTLSMTRLMTRVVHTATAVMAAL